MKWGGNWLFVKILLLLSFWMTISLSEEELDHSADHYYRWLTVEGAQSIIRELAANEASKQPQGRGKDRRSSEPLITGDGFRSIASQLCDETNRCRPDLDKLKRLIISFFVNTWVLFHF